MKEDKRKKFNYRDLMEPPFSGLHYLSEVPGIYSCHKCKTDLFSSRAKFHAGSGWPSFDESRPNAVKLIPTDELPGMAAHCNNCMAFLGTYIKGENFTEKNQRYNVNSDALYFRVDRNEEL